MSSHANMHKLSRPFLVVSLASRWLQGILYLSLESVSDLDPPHTVNKRLVPLAAFPSLGGAAELLAELYS